MGQGKGGFREVGYGKEKLETYLAFHQVDKGTRRRVAVDQEVSYCHRLHLLDLPSSAKHVLNISLHSLSVRVSRGSTLWMNDSPTL